MSLENIDKAMMLGEIALSINIDAGGDAGSCCDERQRRLIARALAREEGAFDDLMVHHQRKVYGVALKVLASVEDARDATQETFLRVFKYLRSYDAKDDFNAWLYRITINVCIDMRRKCASTSTLTADDKEWAELADLPFSAVGDAEAEAIRSEQRRMVEQALAKLPVKERAAIVLRDIEELSTKEVARILGSSESTVRAQVSSARSKIRATCRRLLSCRRTL
ncbi:MAG TPA: sigma-70 family RNA polymerase sigma factor [Blastocatellia bacterium]